MKIFLLLILVYSTLYSQDEIRKFDSLTNTQFYIYPGKYELIINYFKIGNDTYRRVTKYSSDGNKLLEYHDKNMIKYDTLKEWDILGNLIKIEIFNKNGSVYTEFWDSTGQIKLIGHYKTVYKKPKYIKFEMPKDSAFYQTDNFEYSFKPPPYLVRKGYWIEYYENGKIKSIGKYLPMMFSVSYSINAIRGMGFSGYYKKGKWKYFNSEGKLEETISYCKGNEITKTK